MKLNHFFFSILCGVNKRNKNQQKTPKNCFETKHLTSLVLLKERTSLIAIKSRKKTQPFHHTFDPLPALPPQSLRSAYCAVLSGGEKSSLAAWVGWGWFHHLGLMEVGWRGTPFLPQNFIFFPIKMDRFWMNFDHDILPEREITKLDFSWGTCRLSSNTQSKLDGNFQFSRNKTSPKKDANDGSCFL